MTPSLIFRRRSYSLLSLSSHGLVGSRSAGNNAKQDNMKMMVYTA